MALHMYIASYHDNIIVVIMIRIMYRCSIRLLGT